MDEIKLPVYENDMKTIRAEHTAQMIAISFGTIRRLMRLFDIENEADTANIIKIISSAWSGVIGILGNVFPDMTEDEWDFVDTKDIVRVIYAILQNALAEMSKIPRDPKN